MDNKDDTTHHELMKVLRSVDAAMVGVINLPREPSSKEIVDYWNRYESGLRKYWTNVKDSNGAFLKKYQLKFAEGLGPEVSKAATKLRAKKWSDGIKDLKATIQIVAKYIQMLEHLRENLAKQSSPVPEYTPADEKSRVALIKALMAVRVNLQEGIEEAETSAS